MVASFVLLALGLVAAWLAWNAVYPVRRLAVAALFAFMPSWLVAELPLHVIAFQLGTTALLLALGALDAWPGWLGLLLHGAAWLALAVEFGRAFRVRAPIAAALTAGLGPDYEREIAPALAAALPRTLSVRRLVNPAALADRRVVLQRNIVFGHAGETPLRLDLYRPRTAAGALPTLLFVHGGGWVIDHKQHQGQPLLWGLAAQGWLCVTVDYRLSPAATFPDHLIDVKRAIHWLKTAGRAYGAHPTDIVVSGLSAGGHLAALAALTPNDPRYQPGFADSDTRLAGCVSFYGVYDFLDRHGCWQNPGMAGLLRKTVMKVRPDEARDAYEAASPIAQVRRDAPPFLLVHGTRDTLVPVASARHFAAALRAVSTAPVVYMEVAGGQHAFDVFPSVRSELTLQGTFRFLAWLRSARFGGQVGGGAETGGAGRVDQSAA